MNNIFFSRKRRQGRKLFFSALNIAKDRVENEVWDDVLDTAKHNEPKLALEILIYKMWEGNVQLSQKEYDIFKEAFKLFGLGEEDNELLEHCLRLSDKHGGDSS